MAHPLVAHTRAATFRRLAPFDTATRYNSSPCAMPEPAEQLATIGLILFLLLITPLQSVASGVEFGRKRSVSTNSGGNISETSGYQSWRCNHSRSGVFVFKKTSSVAKHQHRTFSSEFKANLGAASRPFSGSQLRDRQILLTTSSAQKRFDKFRWRQKQVSAAGP